MCPVPHTGHDGSASARGSNSFRGWGRLSGKGRGSGYWEMQPRRYKRPDSELVYCMLRQLEIHPELMDVKLDGWGQICKAASQADM